MMSPELIGAAMKMLGVLVLIVGGLLVFNAYSKRFFNGKAGGPGQKAVQVLESTPIGLKKTVSLVRVPGAVLVLGITNDRISLLERMDSQTYKDFAAVSSATQLPSFKDHLRHFSLGLGRKSDAAPSDKSPGNQPC